MLRESELFWLIGILEGEGYFGYQTTQRVAITMTDEDTMLKVALIFGKITGKTCILRDNIVSDARQKQGIKESFGAELYGESARTLMKLVVPYMSIRRRKRIWQSLNGHKQPKVKLDTSKIVSSLLSRSIQ